MPGFMLLADQRSVNHRLRRYFSPPACNHFNFFRFESLASEWRIDRTFSVQTRVRSCNLNAFVSVYSLGSKVNIFVL